MITDTETVSTTVSGSGGEGEIHFSSRPTVYSLSKFGLLVMLADLLLATCYGQLLGRSSLLRVWGFLTFQVYTITACFPVPFIQNKPRMPVQRDKIFYLPCFFASAGVIDTGKSNRLTFPKAHLLHRPQARQILWWHLQSGHQMYINPRGYIFRSFPTKPEQVHAFSLRETVTYIRCYNITISNYNTFAICSQSILISNYQVYQRRSSSRLRQVGG